MNVQLVQAAGEGLLQAKFEALKRKLDAEGLFDPARKRPLPAFPRTVAIVTSPTGAALRDMLHILTRRAPWLRVIISPVRVQGEGAAAEIADAVVRLNRWEELRIDVIVLARGGGSAEDLWQFNEEALARVIAESGIPIVSAVGHEIDFTISDFVADLRAPTPSAAAELVAPDTTEVLRRLQSYTVRIHREVAACLQKQRRRLEYLSRGALLREPRHQLEGAAQRLDAAADSLHRAVRERVASERQRIVSHAAVLRHHRPDHLLALRRQQVATLRRTMTERAQQALARRLRELHRIGEMLRVLSPEATLDRGYTITTNEAGTVIRQAAAVVSGTRLRTRFQDGAVNSTAE
jgi:exodeoxyribonuclease VII large subunit